MNFTEEFLSKLRKYDPNFLVHGLLSYDGRIYQLGTDTKVLSTIFEIIVRPFIVEIAEENGLVVYEPEQQNFYPDFTLMINKSDRAKIAVDIKSTYRRFKKNGSWSASFTLGSYTSFLRNESKNISFPLSDYRDHYIIGSIYSRRTVDGKTLIHDATNVQEALCPFDDVQLFVQEKYRIASEHYGSGNTANIASITASSVEDFAAGNGPFAGPGENVFVDYWRNYDRAAASRKYRNLAEYRDWKRSIE